MDRQKAREIIQKWMFPTARSSYMGGLEDRPVIESGHGSVVVDTNGKEYLDFQSGQMGAALGHQHPKIVQAIQEALGKIVHATKTMLNVPRLKLHERLGQVLPRPLTRSVFLVSGSDSIEASVDLARKAQGGIDVVGLHAGLHGSTSLLSRSLSFNWDRRKHAALAPATSAVLAPYCYRCPLGLTFPSCKIQCLKTSMEIADANFTGKPAAFIAEPILSAGGVIEPPPGYFNAVREACRERDMLLIFDEAQTGLGKTGHMFGCEIQGVVPDIMAISKHFGGGLPISAVCTTDEIAERAVKNGYFATRSHASDPILCAAGLASIDVVVDENLPARAAQIEARMKQGLAEIGKQYGLIGDIRGRGVLLGVELVTDPETKAPANDEAREITRYCLEHGLIFQERGTRGMKNVLRFVPPMTTTDEQVDRALSILGDAFASVTRTRRRTAAE